MLVNLILLVINVDFLQLCDDHPDLLDPTFWSAIGFTFDNESQEYFLIKDINEVGLCLACTAPLKPALKPFCFDCKTTASYWTTGNKALDSFIEKSWRDAVFDDDGYLQWIEYSRLTNVRETPSLHHGCTHAADCLEPARSKLIRVILKKIVDGQDAQSFDFYQVKERLRRNNIAILLHSNRRTCFLIKLYCLTNS